MPDDNNNGLFSGLRDQFSRGRERVAKTQSHIDSAKETVNRGREAFAHTESAAGGALDVVLGEPPEEAASVDGIGIDYVGPGTDPLPVDDFEFENSELPPLDPVDDFDGIGGAGSGPSLDIGPGLDSGADPGEFDMGGLDPFEERRR